jgi:hypothetical protein
MTNPSPRKFDVVKAKMMNCCDRHGSDDLGAE